MSYSQFPAFLLLIASITSHSGSVRANTLNIDLVNDLVSIEAVDVSIVEIAEQLSDMIGIPVIFTDSVDQKITINIFEEPLLAALTKINKNNIVVRKTVNGEEQITEIVFLTSENKMGSIEANLPTGEPTEALNINEDIPQPPSITEEAIPLAAVATDSVNVPPTNTVVEQVSASDILRTAEASEDKPQPVLGVDVPQPPIMTIDEVPAAIHLGEGEDFSSAKPEGEQMVISESFPTATSVETGGLQFVEPDASQLPLPE